MRVAFVLGTSTGGVGRHVRMLAEGLVRRGHQVLVVGPRSTEEAFDFAGVGARFAEVPISDRPHPLNDLRAVTAIRRSVREADVVHAHGLRAGALAALAGRRRHAVRQAGEGSDRRPQLGPTGRRPSGAHDGPSVTSSDQSASQPGAEQFPVEVNPSPPPQSPHVSWAGRGPLVVTLHNALTAGGAIGAVYAVLERIVARRADRVLVVSPDLGERMAALGARDVRVAVVPGAELRPVTRTPDEVRAELGAGDRPVLLTIARLAQQKGLETLLDVAAGPWNVIPLFVIAGGGPSREALQERIDREKLPVLLLGNRDDVPDLLGAATAVVWPSRWEGQPLSLSETLKVGRPVIATAVGGIPGLLGGAGVLVPYGDVEAMRSAVRKVIDDPGHAALLAVASARRGAELPDADDAVEAVLGTYRP